MDAAVYRNRENGETIVNFKYVYKMNVFQFRILFDFDIGLECNFMRHQFLISELLCF